MLIHLLIGSAFAAPQYPGYMESSLTMPCAPQCTVCHATAAGGGGTVTKDFGTAMMTRGLGGGSSATDMTNILDQMTLDNVDSDGDGILDTDELIAGTDPNPGGIDMCGSSALPSPVYGCSTSGAGLSGLGALVAVAAVMRRTRPTAA